jgi:hypothetical protein
MTSRFKSDAVYLLFHLFNSSDGVMHWIPTPYPDCGVDPYGLDPFCSIDSPGYESP